MTKNTEALENLLNHTTPYNILLGVAVPNYIRALEAAARNQAQASHAEIVCALQRYRLRQGAYPESLAALTPALLESVPHDIVSGNPLRYQRTDDGRFLLYSVGWNEKDDGGGTSHEELEGDWVWPMPEK
jgi:type II secretory pathway pseudopilin PulG